MEIERLDEDNAPDAERNARALDSERTVVECEPTVDSDSEEVRAAYHIEYRATVAAEYRAAWDEAAPGFLAAWQGLQKKYPQPERSRPTVDDDGSWHGEGKLALSPEENDVVDHSHKRIREIGENVILPAMLRLEAEDPNRHLAGLKNHIKQPDRLKEKVADEIFFKGRTTEQGIENVKDAVRYTFVYTEERYTESVHADCARLEASGFGRHDRQNSWEHDQYKGINSRWREPGSGLLFEVQFHTQASSDGKELTHRAYERLRGKTAGDAERGELEAFQSTVSAKIPIPPGATGIEDYPPPEKRDG